MLLVVVKAKKEGDRGCKNISWLLFKNFGKLFRPSFASEVAQICSKTNLNSHKKDRST
jgi:hypothetical protein